MIEKTEKQFQAIVVELAQYLGWMVYHTWNSMHSPAGYPDLVMLRGDRQVVAELKSAKGVLSAEQYFWLEAFMAVGAEVYLWQPEDIEAIKGILDKPN